METKTNRCPYDSCSTYTTKDFEREMTNGILSGTTKGFLESFRLGKKYLETKWKIPQNYRTMFVKCVAVLWEGDFPWT